MEPRNVFLSWTRSDEDAKNAVKNYLEAKGITCLDSDETCVGDFEKWSLEAAQMDGVFLLILSKNISSESLVLQEVAKALEMPDADKRIVIVCDDFKIYETFMDGALAQRKLSAITAKFKKETGDPEKTKYLEDSLEKIADKVEIAMGNLNFNVYRENRFPREISLVGADNKSVSFERLYLDRIITEIENGEEKGKINSPKELMEKDGLYFLYGPGGSGKSLYIDQICREAEKTLVVKLSCPDVADSKKSIYDQMFEEVKVHMGGRTYFTDANFKAMLIKHRLFLVLDGMDELSTSDAREKFLLKAKVFCDANREKTGVLFTSRNERDAEIVSFGSIRMFRMDKLTDEEMHRLGKNVFLELGSERDQDTFFVQVSDLSEEIRCNPLLLTQLALIYENGEEIPDDVVGIFDKVNDIILRKPDNSTPPCDELNEDNIGDLLKRFAYEKYNNPQETDENVLATILEEKHPGNALKMAEKCLRYLKERSIYVEGKFLHKMLLEYFTAVSYYESIFDHYGFFKCENKPKELIKELFSHCSDQYWTDMIRLFLIKVDNTAKEEALIVLYEEIFKCNITEYTLLLDTATKLLKRKNIPIDAVCLDILKKSSSGEFPAYGPLFWYIPEYELYESLAKALEQMKGNSKALALTRDVCVLNGKYTWSEIAPSVDGEELFASGKKRLHKTRLALCELFYTGKTKKKGKEVYPRLFDLAETMALMTGGCGICGRREKLFKDELGLYTPNTLPLLGDEYIGFLTLPNDKEVAEAELKRHPSRKVKAVAFMNTAKETFEYIDFYRCNVTQMYLPENVLRLEKYWDSFLQLDRKPFLEDSGIWYQALSRGIYVIPQGITSTVVFRNDKTVTEIHLPDGFQKVDIWAFKGCTCLKKIHLPNGVKQIEMRAFEGCSSLTEIYLPEGLKVIGDEAFVGCNSLTEIYLPEGLKEIATGAFKGCTCLKKINFPEELQKIGRNAFEGCSNLSQINLPDGLMEIGDEVFKGCSSLTAVVIPRGLEEIAGKAFKDCISLAEISMPDLSDEFLRKAIISKLSKYENISKDANHNLPRKQLRWLQKIRERAFEGCSSLKTIHLPRGLYTIEGRTFADCTSLTEAYLPDGLQKLGRDTFEGCTSLKKISLPFYVYLKGLPSDVQIEMKGEKKGAERSKLTSFSFQEGVEEIDEGYFENCAKLINVQLPESLKKIGNYAFKGCSNLTELHLPKGLQKIGWNAFEGCSSLTQIYLPEGLQEIGWNAFEGCSSLTQIHLPKGLKEIEHTTFNGCSCLKKIHLPEKLQVIEEGAFQGCSSLLEIHMPDGLQIIRQHAFNGCSSLTQIHLPEGLQYIGWNAFEGCSSLTQIHLPKGLKKIESRTFNGCSCLTKINLPEELQKIEGGAFQGCSCLLEIHMPDGLQIIRQHAFNGCSSLTEIHLPEGLQYIGWNAFEGCSSLTEIHLPKGLKKIESRTFNGCSCLTKINLPKELQKIEGGAFQGCSCLKDIHLPEELKEIESRTFNGCSCLTEIHLPDGLQYISVSAFFGCSSLTEIHLPEGLQYIGWNAFEGCSSLKEINLPEGLKEIAGEAFRDCVSLRQIHIPKSVMDIKNGAFLNCSSLQKVVILRNFETHIERIFGKINHNIFEFID